MSPAPSVVAVAASGGRDSTALLHATLRPAAALGLRVVALHVHHGLSPHADAWQQHLQRQCARWQRAGWPLGFHAARLSGRPAPGDSVEAWARRERYAALGQLAREQGAGLILLAHHRRDQAETVLLQAMRGAGPAGLAAMPVQAGRDGLVWARPWLALPSEAVEAYVRRHRLSHIEDDSNVDPRFDRNRLRRQVWPALSAAFEQADARLCQVAQQAQRAAALIDEVAAADLRLAASSQGGLDLSVWRPLSAARRWFLLRAWLATYLPGGVPEALLSRLVAELPGARAGRWPVGQGYELRCYRQRLSLVAVDAATASDGGIGPAGAGTLNRAGGHRLPGWAGMLQVSEVTQGGVPARLLAHARWDERRGGEQFQRSPFGIARSLKKQYQSAAIAPWARRGPLIFSGELLLWVPGLGVDARAMAAPGERQYQLAWQAEA